jgi:cell division protein FtsX
MDEDTKKEETQQNGSDGDEKPLDKMTAKELRELAVEIPDVTGVHAMKKDELLRLVKEHRGIQDEKPVRTKKTKKEKKGLSRSELKTKIIELKKQKGVAREAKDTKQVDILRRRISRMKKMTRKVAQG